MEDQTEIEDFIYAEEIDDEDEATYEPETDDAICVFTGHTSGSVFCGYLSKDGKLAMSGGEEDLAYVWDTKTGEIILKCTGHKDSVIFAELNYNETYLATGDMAGFIQVWSLSDKSSIWNYNMDDTIWLKWHKEADILMAGSVYGEVCMWKIPDGDYKFIRDYWQRAESGIILPDGKRLAVGYGDGTIRIFDIESRTLLASVPKTTGHTATITALDCHSDNNLILSAAVDGKTILSISQTGKIASILQDLNSGQEADVDNSNSNWVESVAFCKDPVFQVAATGTLNGQIFIWDISKKVLRDTIEQEGGISKVLWKGTTSLLFSAGLDGILRCFDARSGQCLQLFTGHTKGILDLCISEIGKIALTTSDDQTARIFDISSLC